MQRTTASHDERRSRGVLRLRRVFAATGAVLCALSVAAAAVASHGVAGDARARLSLAAALAFAHGLAGIVLAPRIEGALSTTASLALFAGTVLFSGSLAGAALAHWPTTLAPFGGTLLIAGWLSWAVDLARR